MTRYVIKAPVSSITSDSRAVEKGALFVAYPGERVDGRQYIADAVKKGAAAVVWDEENFQWNEQWNVKNIGIPRLKWQAGYIASQFYKKPSSKMWMVGVTGTNGKTSVSHWLVQAFNRVERKSAVIGTIGYGFLDFLEPTMNTTPGPIELQKILADMLENHADVVAMEVSSHGLDQGRVNGVEFDVAVFTNLTRDHLDYHQTMEAYQSAKAKLFKYDTLKASVINEDDEFGRQLIDELTNHRREVISYGIKSGKVRATKLKYFEGYFTMFVVTPFGKADVRINLMGEFNVYNVLAVLATLLVSEVDFEVAIEAIQALTPVKGRMQILGGQRQPLVVIDYAHTPDALEKVLKALKTQSNSKITCVFGCGGDRDKGKREQMGKIVSQYADAAVVTTDNPRTEDPQKIMNAIIKGMSSNFLLEPDRAKAIAISILSAKAGDVVLIAGKGHEEYQEINGVKHHFSDIEQAQAILAEYDEVLA